MAEIIDCTISSDDEAAPAPAPAPKRRVKQQTIGPSAHVDKKPRISPDEDDDDDVEFLDENPFAPPPLPEPEADDEDDDDDDDDGEDVAITGSKGQNALQHFPHCRENCVVHLFATDPTKHCANCFCVVCDVPASQCAAWPQHCRLKYADPSTQSLRKQARAAALLQQAGGAPAPTPTAGAAGAVAQPARFTITRELHQPDAATSMGALLRAVTQVWPVEALAPQGLAPGTVLRPYQRQSLAFMLDIENAPDSDSRVFRSTRWGGARTLRGGWLCDEVGMGKTLSVISLILSRPRAANELPTDAQWRALQRRHPYAATVEGPPETLHQHLYKGKEVPYDVWWKKMRDSNPKISALCTEREVPNPERAGFTAAPKLPGGARTLTLKATVISCPVTLIGQWQDEIRRWAPELRILVNHGSSKDRNNLNRGKLDASLRDYDVIICSPNTRLSGDSLLVHRELRFHRLIVDEAHATRGATERFLRESALVDPPPPGNTYSRRTFTPRFDSCWLVTGTPFTTGLSQMKTGAAALGCWSGKLATFDGRTQRPKIFAAAADALRALMIRHTKDQVINGGRALSLPKLDARTVRIDLPQAARAGYEQLRASCADKVRRRVGMVKQLQLDMDLAKVRRACADAHVDEKPKARFAWMPTPFTNQIHCATTAKLDALRDDLRSVRQREPHAHCIVFTEHSGAHAKIVAMLEAENDWEVTGLDGSTSITKRHRCIHEFQKFEQKAKVFVLTLKAGACGVTLTAATRLYLFVRAQCPTPSRRWRGSSTPSSRRSDM